MKKLILSLAVVAAGLVTASAQGTIKLYNVSSTYAVSTNGTAYGLGLGKTPTAAVSGDAYYYALLVDTTTPTSSNPLTGGWTLAKDNGVALLATNSITVGSLSGQGGSGGIAVDGWTAGASAYVELVGWSANEGTSFAAIAADLASGTFIPTVSGYYGVSGEGTVISGGSGTPAAPAAAIFGGTGIASGFDLNYYPVPEPTTIALAAMGGLSLLALRRKKA